MKTSKTVRIISWTLLILPSLMLLMSAFMKFSGAEPVKSGLTAAGLGSWITLIALIELIAVTLLLVPKTFKIGFLLINGYLGGAICMELAGGQFPVAAVLLAVIWVGVGLRNRAVFFQE